MLLTTFESIHALSKIYNETTDDVISQLGMSDISSSSWIVKRALNTFNLKYQLIDDKKKALTNISNKTKAMSDSNAELLNNAFETARKATVYRINLELSILQSQLKSIDMEINQLKLMTASDFTKKYSI
jgi:hypothetical protein